MLVADLRFELKNFHQPATFFPKKFFAEFGNFDLKYRVASDYELMRRFLTAKPSHFIDVVVTTMADGGASATMINRAISETAAIAIQFGENPLRAKLRASWVRFWLWVRYQHPQVYWMFKRLKKVCAP
ncbi:putative glycosyl transferase [compost metagenome]